MRQFVTYPHNLARSTPDGSSEMQAISRLSIITLRGTVLGIARVQSRNQGVGVEFGKGKSGNHVQVVLLPLEEEEELHDRTEGGEGTSFDGHSDETTNNLLCT